MFFIEIFLQHKTRFFCSLFLATMLIYLQGCSYPSPKVSVSRVTESAEPPEVFAGQIADGYRRMGYSVNLISGERGSIVHFRQPTATGTVEVIPERSENQLYNYTIRHTVTPLRPGFSADLEPTGNALYEILQTGRHFYYPAGKR